MKRVKTVTPNLILLSVLSAGGFLITVFIVFHIFCAEWRWANEPVHSTVEAIGAVIALLMVYFLLLLSENGVWNKTGVALGFIALGSADVLHALVHPGQAFVFLHSLAGLSGGAGFALTWTGFCNKSPRCKHWAGISVLFFIILIGIWALGFEQTLPRMFENGSFTPLAVGINVLGGLLFLAASWHFVTLYRQTGERDAIVFALAAILFGLSGLAFSGSQLWDATWWFGHLLRLAAYLIVLWLVVGIYRRVEKMMKQSEARLRDIAHSTSDWFWEVDAEGRYTYCSDGVQKILGYRLDELLGKTPFDFVPPEEAARVGKVFGEIAAKIEKKQKLTN